jgi:SAM-dependent MidA family methyltransferase
MTPLKARIVDLIEALGPIPVSEYMALCLSDPRHGYYMTRDPLGRDGDFTTAPEISQMFGELVGAWIAETWIGLGSPGQLTICEIGPGRGTLIKDIVRTLWRVTPALCEATRFKLVEISPKLQWAQATTLKGTGGTFDWHFAIDDLPAGQPLIIVGNEFFDAIPIRQYIKSKGVWRERMVDTNHPGEELRFIAGAGGVDPDLLPPGAADAADGAIAEVAPARAAVMEAIAERIARDGGAGLFFDYGHLEPGIGDTLQAMRAHAYDDVLAHPGEADLTSHVDFAALAEVARSHGLAARLTTQGDFLLGHGLLERAGRLGANLDETRRARIEGEVQRLAGTGEADMGALFKVIEVGRAFAVM